MNSNLTTTKKRVYKEVTLPNFAGKPSFLLIQVQTRTNGYNGQ